jgi:hypothetical protein
MNAPARPAAASARSYTRTWWPFAVVAAVYAVAVAQNITLPGVYMDAVNPDYLAVRLLHRGTEPIGAWLLPGNYLFGRAPVLIAFYHGSLTTWFGLPVFALFGTTVTGLRIAHALFGFAILVSLYALLARGGAKPWQAALACGALALDPGFTYAFRTQSYITLAPAALLFLSLYSLLRAADSAVRNRWLFFAGWCYGLAVVGYFIYAFFLPALVMAVLWWTPAGVRRGQGLLIAGTGLALGGVAYPLGYGLTAANLGGVTQAWDYFQQTQRALNAFSEQPELATRFAHTVAQVESVFRNSFHHTLIFGEHGELPGSGFKMALLLGAPLLLWLRAEWRRKSPVLLRVLVACGVSFVGVALVFGTRLSGHHFMVLQPLAYGAFALGLVAFARTPRIGRTAAAVVALPFAALVALNVGGQVKESLRLQEVRGAGLYSDAINRLAADLLARERRPFAYFPDWGLSMPVAFLTGGRVGMDSLENHEAARRMLCANRDVVVAVVNEDRAARIDAWQRALNWDAPAVDAYRQADGKVVFLLATFRGRRDGPGCGAG